MRKAPQYRNRFVISACASLCLASVLPPRATTRTVDCAAGGGISSILADLKSGDVVVVQGTCHENVLIESDVQRITFDGQHKATIEPLDPRRPTVQVLGREITIRNFTVIGGSFGIAINRGATATLDNNTVRKATNSGFEVSHNSFARMINNVTEHNQQHGILVLGSASVHIGVVATDDQAPGPNFVRNNTLDGIQVLRASTARIIGNMISHNGRNGLTVQQASHADVAGNHFDANGTHGIRVIGNSGVNLADSAMLLFVHPNATSTPNGRFGIQCQIGAYIEGALGTLGGRSGTKDVSDKSCIDRSVP